MSSIRKSEIKTLQRRIASTLKKSEKKEQLIGRQTELRLSALDKLHHLSARSKNALQNAIAKAGIKKLDTIELVLNNLEKIEGDFKVSKLKSYVEQINNQANNARVMALYNAPRPVITTAFNGVVNDAKIDYQSDTVEGFFEAVNPKIKEFVLERLRQNRNIKTSFTFCVEMKKVEPHFIDDEDENEQYRYEDFYVRKSPDTMMNGYEAGRIVNDLADHFILTIDNIKTNSSGWVFSKTKSIQIETVKFKPLRGGSYIELPEWIAKKKACVNVKNEDDECFKWAVLSSIFHHRINSKKSNEVSQYKKFVDELKWDGLNFPVKIEDIIKFEKLNPEYCVNVFILNGGVCPYRVNKNNQDKEIINLLLLEDKGKSHYVSIRNMSRLLNHDGKNKTYHCLNCLQSFFSQDNLNEHKTYCDKNECSKVVMPSDKPIKNKKGKVVKDRNDFIRFKNYQKMLKVPFVHYADFESYLTPVEGVVNSPDKSSTDVFQQHKPASFCLYRVCIDSKYNKVFKYDLSSDDIVVDFLKVLKQSVDEATEIMEHTVPMSLTKEQENEFQNAKQCHICKEPMNDKDIDNGRVRDHCHITGEYRGCAHKKCNLQYRYTYKFPCVFHNLKGYDSHHIISSLGEMVDNKSKIGCIPSNKEKYLTFNWDNIQFIDSIQFMASSLEELAGNIKYEDKTHTRRYFEEKGDKATKLITSKGIFPYDWFSDKSKMNAVKLPSFDEFYSKLTESHITKEDYEKAETVWNTFGCKTFKDYHDLYLITDVLLLADVFENFRNVCMNNYSLDPCHYYTAPGLAWDASLKMTGVELDLLIDYNMYLFIEKGMRGGNSMIAHRYAKANNKYLNDYNPDEKSSHIMYLDANNLYGWAMCQKLPYGDFKWEDMTVMKKYTKRHGYDGDYWDEEIMNWGSLTDDDIMKLDANGDKGYFFEVDLEYPKELHNLHNNYPLAPEKMIVDNDMLSPFSLGMKDKLNISDDNTSKLVCSLSDKKNYVLHIKNLQLYISLGLKVKKVHKVLSFSQKAWLKKYIDFNTNQRKNAKNDFEKDFYKLMNNSVFGKTMENVRNRINFELVCNEKRLLKLAGREQYQGHILFGTDENHIAGVSMAKTNVVLDKPIYVGMAILDLSKTLMYNFHYNTMMKKYSYDKVKLLFTDTDSLCYFIETEDIYKDMEEFKEDYDFSDYPKEHFLHSNDNKKVIGKFKDETNGTPISEFVGLRSKMYGFTYCIDSKLKEKKTAKGIKKYVIKKDIHFQNYKDAIFSEGKEKQFATMNCIRSKRHQLMTVRINKIGLSCYDNKRWVCDDNINTLAYGHYKTLKSTL